MATGPAGLLREAENSGEGAERGGQPEENGHAGVCRSEREGDGAAVTEATTLQTASGQRGGDGFPQSEGGSTSAGCAQSREGQERG